ncbi:uncharacterized protein MYCFIDRAFT_152434 [Pseudocercospora fijiensis CIRAD86]|uniref:Tafazzin family protein n=1 Tax=Pseudocercospora fijiensis (strain CIRAD86) TaxID=383855 RepID=M2Z2W4_PSEFD|nr:uncharacterized protein MYCFIDRAFT_152434 [Pseudocercospora fijiensis CIRAD86]EME84185.1 hypothetical protein MYCFIDRAFT_152434 [Pseudocercospora fijiensis CIRAD86]
MSVDERPYSPSLPWRITSAAAFGAVGFLSRSFLFLLNKTEVRGLDRLVEILDARKDERQRERGLITVSNHVSVLDDPMVWGVLPYRYIWDPNNMRWSLGSYDICFKNGLMSAFFSYGNTLPTHRAAYSKFGGLFQPTMTQCIRLLSDPHSTNDHNTDGKEAYRTSTSSFAATDPFSSAELTYSTNGLDSFPAPSSYPSRRFSWIHIFPEGMIHQHPDKVMRYFKWGVARLILESEPCPDVLPMWIDGPQQVMDNNRGFPRPLPRIGREIKVTFGELVDSEKVFEPFRQKWQELKQRARRKRERVLEMGKLGVDVDEKEEVGVLNDDELKYGKEAEQLRIDLTLAVRNEVLKVRRSCGLPDEDPKRTLADSFREEGTFGRDGLKKDGSSIKQG